MYEEEIKKLLQQIANVDKTPGYEYYSENVDEDRFLNAKKESPGVGCRWLTPREICQEYIRDIELGRIDKSFRLLMGEEEEAN